MKKETIQRGRYNEIRLSQLPASTRKQVVNLVKGAANSQKVDEHGTWDFGKSFDSKGRGYALNWDLYGYGRDYFSKRFLCLIQIRQYEKQTRSGFGNVRKSYFLLGRNEDNTVFAHSVESRVIHRAILDGRDVIRAVQSWIFGIDYTKVIRQGDLAMIPVRNTKAPQIESREYTIENSHKLEAKKIYLNGYLYAENPTLVHLPGTHPTVSGEGLYKIVVGKRADFYDFAAPTID